MPLKTIPRWVCDNKQNDLDMEYIKKADYLESAKKQSRYYELAEVALRVVGQNIPENGKRFNDKNLEEINEKISQYGFRVYILTDAYTQAKYLSLSSIGRSVSYYGDIEIGRYDYREGACPKGGYFSKGCLRKDIDARTALLNEIAYRGAECERLSIKYGSVDEKAVEEFQESFAEFYKEYQKCQEAAKKLPNISLDYISDMPPIW